MSVLADVILIISEGSEMEVRSDVKASFSNAFTKVVCAAACRIKPLILRTTFDQEVKVALHTKGAPKLSRNFKVCLSRTKNK